MVKEAVVKYATILGCLIESNNITNSLHSQDHLNFTKLIKFVQNNESN